jgi:hypothetical protein
MLLLPLLQDATADTVGYMLFGYAVLLGLPILYLISWFIRRRNLERDLDTIKTLALEEKNQPASRAANPAPSDPAQRAEKPSRP